MIEFLSYSDFYNIMPVGHGVDEHLLEEYYDSLWQDVEDDKRRGMDYDNLLELMSLVCGEMK